METKTKTGTGFDFKRYVRGGPIVRYTPELAAAKAPANPNLHKTPTTPPALPPTNTGAGGGGGGSYGQGPCVCPPPLPWPLIPLAVLAVMETLTLLVSEL